MAKSEFYNLDTDITLGGNNASDIYIPSQKAVKEYVDGKVQGARNIGQIIPSSIPLTDAELHLFDGALINGSGIYVDFVTYIAGLVSTYPDLFETEANWQASVTTYGVCGKFVYDSVNNTVRLPKITGIIEGTTDLTALGDLVNAGLPNITGSFNVPNGSSVGQPTYYNTQGCFNVSQSATYQGNASGGGAGGTVQFDASRSSSIYGNSNTVQPQAIKVLYYIVIATSTKTDIQVDIDEIATDLNGKADVDGSNMVNSVKNFYGGWVFSNLTLANDASIPSSSARSYDLSNYLPNDEYNYEIWLNVTGSTGATAQGNGQTVAFSSNLTSGYLYYAYRMRTVTGNWAVVGAGTCIIPIGTDRKIQMEWYSGAINNTGTCDISLKGYRRLGTNQ